MLQGAACWLLLPASMTLLPSAVLLATLGVIVLFALGQAAVLEHVMFREVPLGVSSRPCTHAMLGEAYAVSDAVIGPAQNLWGRALAAIRYDWARTATIGCVLAAVFCCGAFVDLRLRLRRHGLRGESRLRWREEAALQLGLWPAGFAACRAVAPIAAALVPAWFLLPCLLAGLFWNRTDWIASTGVFAPDGCYWFVTIGAPVCALVLASLNIPRFSHVLVLQRLRALGALCTRCGYPLPRRGRQCPECGHKAGTAAERRGAAMRRRARRLPRRAARVAWVLAAIGVCLLFIGGRRAMLDIGFLLRGQRPPIRADLGSLVYLRFDQPYALTLDGQVVLVRASALRYGGASIAAAWRDGPDDEIRVERAVISEVDREQPVMFVAPPSMELPTNHAAFRPPMFFDGRARHEAWILMTLTRRPEVMSILPWRRVADAERESLADLERALHGSAR